MSPHFFMLYLSLQLFTFCLLFKYSEGSVNPKFEACQPKTCGNGQIITYPFYIEKKQEPFCGFPRFGLSCENGFPRLNLSQTFYIVQEIFYANQSLRVSNPAFSNFNSSNCISPPHNLTLHGNNFDFARNQTELFLFFNCSLPEGVEEYRIGCSARNKTSSVLAMDKEDEKLKDAWKNCTGGMVKTMVEEGYHRGGGEGFGEALRRGFVLKWTVTDCGQCERSGGKCGFDKETFSFRCFCRDGEYPWKCNSETTWKTVLVKTTVGSSAGVAMLLFLAWCFKRKLFSTAYGFFWRKNHPANQIIETFLKQHGPLPTRRYSYSEIKEATNCFKIKLGQGGYGSVYKGKLHDGRLVAVKILSESKGTGEEFINEVASISRTSHVNIVNLLGFCFQGSKKALVYEFMSNGSLEKFIYEENNMVDRQLDCKTSYDIAIGVARGLEYLHRACNTRILHFDIKPHNILLDEDFCPKISDFGLAKICPRKESIVSLLDARGTAGYIAPEVFSRIFGEVSHKSDVYSYGMMVLEMVGRRRNINVDVDHFSELYFPHWIYKRIELNQELELRCIKNETDKEIMKKMTIVSLWCIQTNPATRPAINTVVEMLEGSLESLQVPPKPYLSSPSRSPALYSIQTCETL